jgi:hypothetical protein
VSLSFAKVGQFEPLDDARRSRCPSVVTGKPEMRPSGTPYDPSDGTAIETQSPSAVGLPPHQFATWSISAFAADAADDAPRASMMALPALLDGAEELALEPGADR